MVLPGIQALFSFQMIAVFNNGFTERLWLAEQKLHIDAIFLVVISIVLVMTPAALHPRAEPKSVSDCDEDSVGLSLHFALGVFEAFVVLRFRCALGIDALPVRLQ